MLLHYGSPLVLIPLVSGIALALTGQSFKRKPAHDINYWKGYHSRRARSSQQAWDYAQLYCSRIMGRVGLLLVLIALGSLFLPDTGLAGVFISLSLVIGTAILVPIATEQKLKQLFSEKGERLMP